MKAMVDLRPSVSSPDPFASPSRRSSLSPSSRSPGMHAGHDLLTAMMLAVALLGLVVLHAITTG